MVAFVALRPLTPRQAEVLRFICDRVRVAWMPSWREIGERFGFTSTNAVYDHIRLIEKKGYVRRPPRTKLGGLAPRSLCVLYDADGLPFHGRSGPLPLPDVLVTDGGEAWGRVPVDLAPREVDATHEEALIAVAARRF